MHSFYFLRAISSHLIPCHKVFFISGIWIIVLFLYVGIFVKKYSLAKLRTNQHSI